MKTTLFVLSWLALAGWIGPALSRGGDAEKPCGGAISMPETPNDGWTLEAPRDEIATKGDFDGAAGVFRLSSPAIEGANGWWEKSFAVEGGKTMRFSALRLSEHVEYPRRSCAVRIEWFGPKGEAVESPEKVNPAYFGQDTTTARPEFPRDKEVRRDGWTVVEDLYAVPEKATRAVVQLHLRWAANGSVAWKNVTFAETAAPEPRKVKLAAIHHNLPGSGHSVVENRGIFAPLIAEAAEKGADLVVLPELLTCKGVSHDYASLAEPVPGPSTDYFAGLAKKHDCYIVAGLPERDGPLVYNVAVLLGPEGKIAGKYRKVTLPREEIQRGIAPGHDYPVFETRFGKVGMMICYDVFFPEVARQLAKNGAEVIALPIWGGNPRLAAARCAENGVYLVSSTYTDHHANWMKSAVWNREGDRLAEAAEWGSVVMAEVDLNERTYWNGLGDFQARIAREAPVWEAEAEKTQP